MKTFHINWAFQNCAPTTEVIEAESLRDAAAKFCDRHAFIQRAYWIKRYRITTRRHKSWSVANFGGYTQGAGPFNATAFQA